MDILTNGRRLWAFVQSSAKLVTSCSRWFRQKLMHLPSISNFLIGASSLTQNVCTANPVRPPLPYDKGRLHLRSEGKVPHSNLRMILTKSEREADLVSSILLSWNSNLQVGLHEDSGF